MSVSLQKNRKCKLCTCVYVCVLVNGIISMSKSVEDVSTWSPQPKRAVECEDVGFGVELGFV